MSQQSQKKAKNRIYDGLIRGFETVCWWAVATEQTHNSERTAMSQQSHRKAESRVYDRLIRGFGIVCWWVVATAGTGIILNNGQMKRINLTAEAAVQAWGKDTAIQRNIPLALARITECVESESQYEKGFRAHPNPLAYTSDAVIEAQAKILVRDCVARNISDGVSAPRYLQLTAPLIASSMAPR